MALASDRFDLLFNEIVRTFSSLRDHLAILGAVYSVQRVLRLTWQVYKALKVHGLSNLSRQDLRRYGPWAVVTGSTHGIGKAFAQELASHGINIIIVSLGEADCEKIASKIEKNFRVQTHIIPVDFSEGRQVYDVIEKELEGREIGILLNNVGVMYDYPQCFLEVPLEKLWQLVHVNVAAATMMTHIVLPQMVERRRGAVIFVSSGASCLPSPQISVYSATKAYLDFFARGLAYEYRSQGIEIQCLRPFYVATRMTRYSSTLSNPSMWIPSATTYARHALRTLSWSPRTTGYWPHTVQLWLCNMIPERIWLWGSMRLNSALRRQALQRARSHSVHKLPALAAARRRSSGGADLDVQ